MIILVMGGVCVILVRVVDDLWVVCVRIGVLMIILCHVAISLVIAHVRMFFLKVFIMFSELSCSDSKN